MSDSDSDSQINELIEKIKGLYIHAPHGTNFKRGTKCTEIIEKIKDDSTIREKIEIINELKKQLSGDGCAKYTKLSGPSIINTKSDGQPIELHKINELIAKAENHLKEQAAQENAAAAAAEEEEEEAEEKEARLEEELAKQVAAAPEEEEEKLLEKAMNYFDNAVTQKNIADDFISIEVNQTGEVEGGKKPAKKPKRKANKTKRAKKSNKKKRKPKRKTMRKIKKIIFR